MPSRRVELSRARGSSAISRGRTAAAGAPGGSTPRKIASLRATVMGDVFTLRAATYRSGGRGVAYLPPLCYAKTSAVVVLKAAKQWPCAASGVFVLGGLLLSQLYLLSRILLLMAALSLRCLPVLGCLKAFAGQVRCACAAGRARRPCSGDVVGATCGAARGIVPACLFSGRAGSRSSLVRRCVRWVWASCCRAFHRFFFRRAMPQPLLQTGTAGGRTDGDIGIRVTCREQSARTTGITWIWWLLRAPYFLCLLTNALVRRLHARRAARHCARHASTGGVSMFPWRAYARCATIWTPSLSLYVDVWRAGSGLKK